ncbi:MAG TPA: hypothetical protein VFF03_02295 [Rhodocyclaceae bacterium]|nr:hypothetical protein [Rhodocyclaceae bacterium]
MALDSKINLQELVKDARAEKAALEAEGQSKQQVLNNVALDIKQKHSTPDAPLGIDTLICVLDWAWHPQRIIYGRGFYDNKLPRAVDEADPDAPPELYPILSQLYSPKAARAAYEDAEALMRDNMNDTGLVPSVGVVSCSPDVIPQNRRIDNYQTIFAESWALTPAYDEIDRSKNNYLYVRCRAIRPVRKNHEAADYRARPLIPTIKVYWSAPATLIRPRDWNLIGSSYIGDCKFIQEGTPNDIFVGEVEWPRDQIPNLGHYCFVGVLDAVLDRMDDPKGWPAFRNPEDFENFIRRYNNAVWHNFNVVGGSSVRVGGRSVLASDRSVQVNFQFRAVEDLAAAYDLFVFCDDDIARNARARPLPVGTSVTLILTAPDQVSFVTGPFEFGGSPMLMMRAFEDFKVPNGEWQATLELTLPPSAPSGRYCVTATQTFTRRPFHLGGVSWILNV